MKYIVILILVASLGAAGWKTMGEAQAKDDVVDSSSVFEVIKGSMNITVTETGYLKAKESLKLQPEFERSGVITWLIEEGTEVKEGDKLVEFDKSDLEEQISELQNKLIQYKMEQEAGEAELGIQERDNVTALEKAELALDLAELAKKRYLEGEAPNEMRKKKLAHEKAKSVFSRLTTRYSQVPQLLKEGFMTENQAEEERINLREAEINLENVERELELYKDFDHPMELTKKETAVKDAKRELANANIKAEINFKQKSARVEQQKQRVTRSEKRLEELAEEEDHMTMTAPQTGLVHYGDPSGSWYWGEEIKIGSTMRKGNTIITLPDLSVMQVKMQVHEADIDQVTEDMEVIVTIDTHKGMIFPAKVTDIASVASSSRGEATGKTFDVEVTLEPFEADLRAGVTARAEIQIMEIEDAIQVPIHSVHAEGEEHFCFVHENEKVVQRSVKVGRNNAQHVEVLSGLEPGEKVLLYDPRITDSVSSDLNKDEEPASPLGGATESSE